MANLNEYIYEEILTESLKLNRLSNKLGKIILTIYNSLSKLEDGENYDEQLSLLKRMRVELLTLEKKVYSKSIDSGRVKAYISSYANGLKKISATLSSIDDKKIKRALSKMDNLIDDMKNLKVVL